MNAPTSCFQLIRNHGPLSAPLLHFGHRPGGWSAVLES